jgi:hypothetical protein
MRQATIDADLDRVLELIDQLVSYDAPLAKNLRRLAEGFSYQEILEVLPVDGE